MSNPRSSTLAGYLYVGLMSLLCVGYALGQAPETIELSGVVRDFKRAHPDFNVVPIGGPGHYAANIGLNISGGDRPAFAGGGFKVADQWRNSGAQPIAPHLFGVAGAGSAAVKLVDGPVIEDTPTIDTFNSLKGPYDKDTAGPAPDFEVGAEMPVVTEPTGLPPLIDEWKVIGAGTTVLDYDIHCNKFAISNYHEVQVSGNVTVLAEQLFKIENYTSLVLLPGATMEVYFKKDAVIENNVQVNVNTYTPSRLVIYNLGVEEFNVKNNVDIYAQVISPNGSILIENNGDLYGTYTGKRFHIKNTGGFHADTSAGGGGGMMCGAPVNDTAGAASVISGGGITSAATFDGWYTDSLGVNLAKSHSITLTRNGSGVYEYLDGQFYPIDGQLFGNEGDLNNYYFTYEIEAEFTYQACAGQFMEFAGADDCWIFIDGFLGIDLGGITPGTEQVLEMDRLGLTDGEIYEVHVFFAHRESKQSAFNLRTNLELWSDEVTVTASLPCD